MYQIALILLILCLTINKSLAFKSDQKLRKIANKWDQGQCEKYQVYLRRPVVGCYNKSALNDPCYSKHQCIPNAFCGFPPNSDLTQHHCLCTDGFQATSDGTICIPIHSCSINDFNPTFDQADCPLDKEFCQYSVCLCRPSYRRDSTTGGCTWSVPDQVEPKEGWYSKVSNYLGALSWIHLVVVVFGIVVIAFGIILAIYLIYRKQVDEQAPTIPQKRSFRQLSRQNSESKRNLVSTTYG